MRFADERKSVANIFLGGFLILELTIISSCNPVSEPACIGWEFSTDGNSEGWLAGDGINLEILDGKLVGEITQFNGYWIGQNDLNINAAIYRTLEIRYRAKSFETSDVTYFYWIKASDPQFGNNKRIKFDIQTNHTWQNTSIDLAQNANWSNGVIGIQLNPVLFSGPSTVIEYDYIRLCK